jgi:DNA polymerase sigma
LIEPLLLVLKQLLKVNGLNEPFKGGMSSYGLLLMIVGFLQFRQYDIPCEPKHQNLGEILLDFLQYFSNFDFKNK